MVEERSAEDGRSILGLLREFWMFIKHEKKWWLLPLIILLLLLGIVIIFAETSPLAPFLYPLF